MQTTQTTKKRVMQWAMAVVVAVAMTGVVRLAWADAGGNGNGGPHGVVTLVQNTITNGTASTAPVVIDTPTTNAIYTIGVYPYFIGPTNSTAALNISFTDVFGNPGNFTFGGQTAGNIIVGPGPVSISVVYTPNASNTPYNIFYSFTKL